LMHLFCLQKTPLVHFGVCFEIFADLWLACQQSFNTGCLYHVHISDINALGKKTCQPSVNKSWSVKSCSNKKAVSCQKKRDKKVNEVCRIFRLGTPKRDNAIKKKGLFKRKSFYIGSNVQCTVYL
jgi:hypothetical protein